MYDAYLVGLTCLFHAFSAGVCWRARRVAGLRTASCAANCAATELAELALSGNQLTGSIPNALASLPLLRELRVDGKSFTPKMHFVDLAGSERFSYRTKDVASFESRNINLSLHHLEHVVRTLCETAPALSPRKHVPYRNSVLTSMLRDSLGGNCRTALVATLAADAEHAREAAASSRGRQCSRITAQRSSGSSATWTSTTLACSCRHRQCRQHA